MGLHSDITDDPNLHNPKGFATAANNTRLEKNAAGDVEWVSSLGGSIIEFDSTNFGTGGDTSETILYGHTIPADILSAAGQGLKVFGSGNFGANGNSKRLLIKVDGNDTIDSGSYVNNGGQWDIEVEIYFITSGIAGVRGTFKDESGDICIHFNEEISVDFTAAFEVDVIGQNGTASANDVLGEFSRSNLIT